MRVRRNLLISSHLVPSSSNFDVPVGCTHPTIAGFTLLYRCWTNLRTRHFAPLFEGGSRFPQARGAFRKFLQHKEIGITRWAIRESDYTVARVVPERHGAAEVLFTMFDEVFSIGISCMDTQGGCPPLGFVVLAFQAGWRRIEVHNVVIRK